MARPVSLDTDLSHIKSEKIDDVVSLLQKKETRRIGIAKEAEVCAQLGLTFIHHPIQDMHLPDPQQFIPFVTQITDRLRSGHHIAVHCYASIGRSGMLCSCVLGCLGFSPAEAIAHVSSRRGAAVPDTHAQAEFISRTIEAIQT